MVRRKCRILWQLDGEEENRKGGIKENYSLRGRTALPTSKSNKQRNEPSKPAEVPGLCQTDRRAPKIFQYHKMNKRKIKFI